MNKPLLLRVLIGALIVGALAGAGAVLFGANDDVLWQAAWSAALIAGTAALMWPLSNMMDKEVTRSAGLLGSVMLIVVLLLFLASVWSDALFGSNDYHLLLVGFILLFLTPFGMFCLRIRETAVARPAGTVGVTLVAIVTACWVAANLIDAYGPYQSHLYEFTEKLGWTGAATAAFGATAVIALIGLDVKRRPWPILGVLASIGGWLIAFAGIWWFPSEDSPILVYFAAPAIVMAQANLALLCPTRGLLQQRFVLATIAVTVTAAICMVIVVSLPKTSSTADVLFRLGGAFAVFAAFGCIGLIVIARINRPARVDLTARDLTTLTLICPRCDRKQTLSATGGVCTGCRLEFEIRLKEPRCGKCGYLLYMIEGDRCPECGEAISPGDAVVLV